MITRRELLRAIALGGGIVAGELWVPGARKVFLPTKPRFERVGAWRWTFRDNWTGKLVGYYEASDFQTELQTRQS